MKGEQINNLCKTLGIMDELIYMSEKLKVVDPPHVMLMEVESLDGSPVFGIVDDRLLDPVTFIKLKVDGKAEFNVVDEDNKYILRNEDSYYSVPIIEDGHLSRTVKVPYLDLHEVEVSGKMLKNFIRRIPKDCVSVALSIEDGVVWIKADNGSVECRMRLGITDDRYVNVLSKFDPDYMKKWIKVTGSTVTLGLNTDYPMTAEWSDSYYKYKVLLAPRIESE